jgi:hypothetical protein
MKLVSAVIVAFAACAWTAPAAAENFLVGPGGVPASLRDALRSARDGDTIDLLPGEYVGESTIVPPLKLTIRGIGKTPVFNANGKVDDAKAILVVRGGDVTIENVEFRGVRGDAANGAGVRLEGGRLRVVRCRFVDDEYGLLALDNEASELQIDASMFSDAPRVVGGLYHLLYVGRIGKLTLTGSRFHRGFEGHLVKSRARENRISYNLIYDGPGGGASYEIDLPNGGLAWIVGNVIGQSSDAQNPVAVAYGTDGRPWLRNALYMAHNTLINQGLRPAWFLRVFRDRLPDGTEAHAVNNLTVGLGVFEWGASGDFDGNHATWSRSLVDPDTLAFELKPDSWLRGRGVDPRRIGGQDLSPKAEFAMPAGTRPLPPLTSWSPGAFQR